ncbi:MAG: hypothetical protein GX075_06555 [Firmicutes bacterium]|nr:hypothetical protein [Bacillota bacterium]
MGLTFYLGVVIYLLIIVTLMIWFFKFHDRQPRRDPGPAGAERQNEVEGQKTKSDI